MPRHASIFHERARAAGIDLRADVSVPWLTRNGHLAPVVQSQLPGETLEVLDRVLDALDGDAAALAAKTRGSSRVDFIVEPRGVVVEYDEVQHFTTARLKTLALYPTTARLGFDLDEYVALVRRWASRGDRGFAHKEAAEFPGRAGRQRQRAYFDTLRDLVAPHFDNGPLIRIPSPANDYDAAVARLRSLV